MRSDDDDDDNDNNGGGGESSLQEEEEKDNGADGQWWHLCHQCPRVISLLDPTQTLDYEEELRRVTFWPVRTSEELEEAHAFGRNVIARKTINYDGPTMTNIPLGCRHKLNAHL